jgi:sec-independent protein translocase protein TatB
MVPGLSIEHLVILGVIALVVVGPKDLPLLLRKLGQFTAKLRGMAQEFRSGFDELARQAELDELKKEVEALRRTTNLTEISKELTKPLGTLESYAGLPPVEYPPPPPPQLSEAETAAEPAKVETPIATPAATLVENPVGAPSASEGGPNPAAANHASPDLVPSLSSDLAAEPRSGESLGGESLGGDSHAVEDKARAALPQSAP